VRSAASPVRLCIITDRRLAPAEQMIAMLRAALPGLPAGAVSIQLREKDLDGGPLLALACALAEVAREVGARLWVNERIDVALAAGASGVHLPEHSFSVDEARRLAPRLAVGVSRHGADAAKTAQAADWVQLGPIWATPSKAGMGLPLGEAALAVRARLPATTRLIAVGGIDSPARASAAIAADAVAMIRAFWSSPSPGQTVRDVLAAIELASTCAAPALRCT
jgi:thiamine-phosphate pyrophosphorylase